MCYRVNGFMLFIKSNKKKLNYLVRVKIGLSAVARHKSFILMLLSCNVRAHQTGSGVNPLCRSALNDCDYIITFAGGGCPGEEGRR